MIASGSTDATVRIWNTADETLLHSIRVNGAIRQVAFSPVDTVIAAFFGTTIQMWNAATGSLIHKISRPQLGGGMAYSPSGKLIATGATDQSVRIWNTGTGTLRHGYYGRLLHKVVLAVSFLDNDRSFATTHENSLVNIWSTDDSLWPVQDLPDPSITVPVQLAYSADMIAASSDKVIRLWHVPTQSIKGRLTGHVAEVLCLAFSPDGKSLVSGSADRTIKMWDVPNVKLLGGFNEYLGPIFSVAFSPDGQSIATGSSDRTVRLWLASALSGTLKL
jgi:WD40 repeat protein